jgi:peptidoglycan/LPS O-acetylase OafA/YrhL
MTATAPRLRGHSPSDELRARPSATGKDRIVALDGLRAFALLIIMGYHFGLGWLGGGFFSLDIFYVLSGYLITGLLIGEYGRRGSVKLSAFWLRRARRLLPALAIVLVVVTLLVRYDAAPDLYPDFRMSALSSFFYFSNWWQIASSTNYFVATGPPSPLTHTWSLAVEEQFYLVWPLVVLAVMHLSRSFARGVKTLLVVSVIGALASAAEMILLYHPRANTTRLYFGTDTHGQSILIGAVLACTLSLVQMRRGEKGMAPRARGRATRSALVVLGAAGFGGTLTLTYLLTGTDAFDYRGGFTLSALSAAAIIVAAVCVPSGPIARGLSVSPLVWLGTISYGAYLWHYPVYVFVDTSATGLSGFWLFVARFAATVALAATSYYLVERPIMTGTFWRSLRAVAPATAAVVITVVVIVAGTAVPATAAVEVHRYQGGATTTHTRIPSLVVLGDSLAVTLGVALQTTAPTATRVVEGGLFGCGLAIGSWVSNDPPTPQLAMFPACNSASPASEQWPALDAKAVADSLSGDVVLFVAGNWEVQDILRNGQWVNITQPGFRRYELAQMRTLVRMATAHGAHLELATLPASAVGASFHEKAFPEDSPKRHLLYDHLIETVARQYPGKVSIIDLNKILSPGGVFHQYLDGVQVRTFDGLHTPAYAPNNPYANNSSPAVAEAFDNWLSPRIWPAIFAADTTTTARSP